MLCRKNDPERMSGSSETYLFNSSYNIDLSNKVTRRLKICVSFADTFITEHDPGARADNPPPWGNVLYKYSYFVNMVICCQLFSIA